MSELVPVEVKGNVGTIEDNLDAVEASIREKVQEYNAVVITEDSIADGQKFRASINKEKKNLDDERKAIKKEWMKPYEEFEKRAKRIIALYDEPLQIIDQQLNEFEENRKAMKRQEIRDAYDFVKGDLEGWLPLEKIYDPRWENKTYSSKSVRQDMEREFGKMQMYIDTVKSSRSEFVDDGLKVLKETGDLQAALAEMNNLQEMKERLEAEQKAREEELARLKAEQEALEAEQEALEADQEQAEENQSTEEPDQEMEEPLQEFPSEPAEEFQAFDFEEDMPSDDKFYTVTVKVPESGLRTLRDMLDAIGVEYEVN